jgi:hypothetical protein
MSSLHIIDRQPFEDLFDMSSGYVLNPHLTNQTFQSFIAESAGKDIYASQYAKYGDSKAKRLRAFWDIESDQLVGKVLSGLVDLWQYKNPEPTARQRATVDRCRDITARLLGKSPASSPEITEEQFLNRDFSEVAINKVPIEASLIPILDSRLQEAVRSLNSNCPLSTVFMCGSVLEGLLLGMALANPKRFNQALSAPKDIAGKVRQFPDWTLAHLIDVSCELGLLKLDVKKFSHALRDFRNYIHPYQQLSSQFVPDRHTAQICLQVLKAAIASLSGHR